MIVYWNPDEWETFSEHHTCPFHRRNPGVPWAGCTCSGSYGMRRKGSLKPEKVDPESLAEIKRICGHTI